MNILHVDTGREWRGGQAQVFNLIKYLPEEVESHLLTPTDSELSRRIRDVLPKNRIQTHALRGEWDLSAGWKLRNLHRDHDYDLIHAHSSHALGIAWLASVFFRLPPYIETRRLETHVAGNWFSKQKYNSAHHHIANSKTVKEALVESGLPRDQVTVVPSGVDLSRIDSTSAALELLEKNGIDPNRFIIGNVGALSPQKDHELLIDVASEIVEEFPNVRFVVAGDGELREELKQQIHRMGLEDHVYLLGFVENIFGLYKCFDLYVTTARYEGLCGTIMQAMACKIPVISSNVRGSQEILNHGENCRVVDVGERSGFVNEITGFLSGRLDPDQHLGAARNTAEQFDYPAIAKQTRNLYHRLIN